MLVALGYGRVVGMDGIESAVLGVWVWVDCVGCRDCIGGRRAPLCAPAVALGLYVHQLAVRAERERHAVRHRQGLRKREREGAG